MAETTRLNRKEKREARFAVQPFFMVSSLIRLNLRSEEPILMSLHILPQAEHDSALAAKIDELIAEEKEIMKGRKDWVYGKYIKC